MKKVWWAVAIVLLPLVVGALEVNEVMYAPTAAYGGSGNEWIELYNDNERAYGAFFCSLDGAEVENFTVEPYGYLVIAKVLTTFTDFYPNITAIDGNFNFNNAGDTIVWNCSDVNLSFSYTPDLGALSNDKTLERNFEQEWGESKEAGGTPGRVNSIANTSFHDLTLVISEVMANPWENDDWPAPDGEWVELFNYGDQEVYAGGLKLTDAYGENELFIAESSTLGDIFVLPGEYLVVYRDGDSDFSLNNNGYEEVRLIQEKEDMDILIDWFSYPGTTEGMSWSIIEEVPYLTSPTPLEDNEYTGECIWGLFIDTNNSIYRPEEFSFSVMVNRFAGLKDEITVYGQIEDEHGEIIRTYTPWQNETVDSDRQQRYSPNLLAGMYQISFWFENPPCLDIDPSAYRVTKLIGISDSYQRYDSMLQINELNLGSDKKVKWGQQFSTKLTAYRSNGTQSTLEIWAEKSGKIISQKTKVNAPAQFTQYSFTIPLQLIPNCDGKIHDGAATLRVEGMGTSAARDFTIDNVDSKICTDYLDYVEDQEKADTKLAYSITQMPSSVVPGSAFKVTASVHNDDKSHLYNVWAYVYRGSKCYSCKENTQDRDSNLEKFTLDSNEDKEIYFPLKLDENIDEGEYKIKVIFNKDNQKTNKEAVETFYVQMPVETKTINDSISVFAEGDPRFGGSSLRSRITDAAGIVVYESNDVRSKKAIPYLLLISAALVVAVMWKRK